MDGSRLRAFWTNDAASMWSLYLQFETLLPKAAATGTAGASHPAEDGRFVEELVRGFLRKHLPSGLEVLTGFILRPAVKTGKNARGRSSEKDSHSGQLDIIVYDHARYPILERFGDSAIVIPEGVIGVISIKKTLRPGNVKAECEALNRVGALCSGLAGPSGTPMRGPFLAIFGIKDDFPTEKNPLQKVFKEIKCGAPKDQNLTFDHLVGYVGTLEAHNVFKERPTKDLKKAKFRGFRHGKAARHLPLQFLLSGLLSVIYDETRTTLKRPGLTAFPAQMPKGTNLGCISVSRLR